MIRLCFLLFGLLLAACTTPPLPTLPDRRLPAAVQLAPFEEADQIPPQIARLPFDDGRAYAILVQIPAPAVVMVGLWLTVFTRTFFSFPRR